ncbi:MAG: hypothetical protein AB8F34_03375 [Akkermansiaceae bacterium]
MAYTAEKAFDLIESAHEKGRLAHAFLITGVPGSGKNSLAAKIISLVNSVKEDSGANLFGEVEEPLEKTLEELEGELVRIVRPRSKSRRISVDDMRALEKSFHVASAPGKWKVGVILHADRMGVEAENAFLKTLEEPPADCLLLLLSDSPELLLPTILSRCVRLSLMARPEERELGGAERQMLEALARSTRDGFGRIAAAFTLRASFSRILAEKRAEISKANDVAFREESKKYKNTTDSDDWLKDREKFYLAHTESEYLNERDRLLETIIAWMGDVLRQKCGVTELDLTEAVAATQKAASAHTLPDLLQRVDALEELRANLETNAQEQLALEVAFLKAFA